ncbi:glycosyltransferase family 4 protein [Bacillus salitolerans]|uniref:Glycosyltransferase family 4 protein n=1 Tax=Bacillus salitolerans TaxID=1437434 RepID=A0ABW4LLE2_9BACI
MSKLKIGFFTPYYKSNRGNATTTRRIIHGLNRAGVETYVVPYLEESWSEEKDAKLAECQLYHMVHLFRFTRWNMCRELPLTKPYILTSGGTDINHDIANADQVKEMAYLVDNASFITVFTEDAKQKLAEAYPSKVSEINIIPQSVWFEDSSDQRLLNIPKGKPTIFLPAGIRKVKDPLYVWKEIKTLKDKYKDLQFIIAGVVIEKDLFKEILSLCQKYDWVHFFENVPFGQMEQLYRQADITINTSISEGQSSALIEAMYCGSPLIVRKNEGNLSVVTHGKTGFVFEKQAEFHSLAIALLENSIQRKEIIANAHSYVLKHHSLETEISRYVSLYKQLV